LPFEILVAGFEENLPWHLSSQFVGPFLRLPPNLGDQLSGTMCFLSQYLLFLFGATEPIAIVQRH
jgi:hypothetical protein